MSGVDIVYRLWIGNNRALNLDGNVWVRVFDCQNAAARVPPTGSDVYLESEAGEDVTTARVTKQTWAMGGHFVDVDIVVDELDDGDRKLLGVRLNHTSAATTENDE